MGGRSLTGVAGVAAKLDAAPGTRAFGALDAGREFSAERKVRVSGTELRSKADVMWFRLRLGGAHAWNDGRLRGWANCTAAGDEFGGGGRCGSERTGAAFRETSLPREAESGSMTRIGCRRGETA